MKAITFMISILALILIPAIEDLTLPQTPDYSILQKQIKDNDQNLKSEDFKQRGEAVYFFTKIRWAELPPNVIKSIKDLFKKEVEQRKLFDDFVMRGGTAENLPKDIAYINSKEYGTYHGYLCELCGRSGDKDLLPLLVQYCLEPKIIIKYGDSAVGQVINVLKTSNNSIRRMSAVFVLNEMLKQKDEGYTAKGKTRRNIIDALVQASRDGNRYVRSVSVEALGESQDEDVIPILENIAKTDPFYLIDKGPSGEEVRKYPVREDAKKALEKLKK